MIHSLSSSPCSHLGTIKNRLHPHSGEVLLSSKMLLPESILDFIFPRFRLQLSCVHCFSCTVLSRRAPMGYLMTQHFLAKKELHLDHENIPSTLHQEAAYLGQKYAPPAVNQLQVGSIL